VSKDPAACAVPEETRRFINGLYEPDDVICFRPTETWTDSKGEKHSEVKHSACGWVRAKDFATFWPVLVEAGEAERANAFFGVNPRYGEKHYDRSFQIRKVRALYADLDGVTVHEAKELCREQGIPEPSIIVASGHGVHLYWLLVEAYLIDDVGDPPKVMKDQGKNQKPYYIDADGNRVQKMPPVSPKADLAQRIMAGIAARIGGDATQDLARILRLPGTLNRKNQRNGQEPVPCVLAEMDESRRYDFADFERFAVAIKQPPTPKPSTNGTGLHTDSIFRHSPNDDDWLLSKIRRSKNGSEFWALYNGDNSKFNGDKSRGDMSVCDTLAFWTVKDKSRMDRMFRMSPRMRAKWDEIHDGQGRTYGEMTLDDAINFCQDTYEPKPKKKAKKTGKAASPPSQQTDEKPPAEDQDPTVQAVLDLIVQDYQERFQPVHRTGDTVWSSTLCREVSPSELTRGPSPALAGKLLSCPAVRDEGITWNDIPKLYNTWKQTALVMLLSTLHEEESAPEVDQSAGEDFEEQLATALHTIISIGHKYSDESTREEVTQVQQRSLIEWALLFAKPGKWASIRSYNIWTAKDADGKVQVAIRSTLFGQIRRADLKKIKQRKLSTLCERYGIGRADRINNATRVVILSQEFLRRITGHEDGICDVVTNGKPHAHARENERHYVTNDGNLKEETSYV
jgi:hypothetical protein